MVKWVDGRRSAFLMPEEKLSMIGGIQKEIDLYRQYGAFYGNVLFGVRRR